MVGATLAVALANTHSIQKLVAHPSTEDLSVERVLLYNKATWCRDAIYRVRVGHGYSPHQN